MDKHESVEFLFLMARNFTAIEHANLCDLAANGTTAPYNQDLED